MTREQARAYRRMIEKGVSSLSDDYAYNAPELFEKWSDARKYEMGDRRCFNGKLYKCLQGHTSQPDWAPDVAVSLWVEIADPSIEYPEWKQPTGAQDAYMLGDKVSHNGKHWVSKVDNNVWEPGATGSEALWEER